MTPRAQALFISRAIEKQEFGRYYADDAMDDIKQLDWLEGSPRLHKVTMEGAIRRQEAAAEAYGLARAYLFALIGDKT